MSRTNLLRNVVDAHRSLDQAFEEQLGVVRRDTESAAVRLTERSRSLFSSARALQSEIEASDAAGLPMIQRMIADGESLNAISSFLDALPSVLRDEVTTVQRSANEQIEGLNAILETMQEITRHTKVVSVNAAVIAASVGELGRAFSIVASEMRELAERSAEAVTKIDRGLAGTKRTMRASLELSGIERQLREARTAATSINGLQASQRALRDHYEKVVALVQRQNEAMLEDIGAIMNEVQGQDVVQQRLQRLSDTLAARGAMLADLPEMAGADLAALGKELVALCDTYTTRERGHSTVRAPEDNAKGSSFELF